MLPMIKSLFPFKRIAIIGLFSLVLGIAVNQLHTKGISFKILTLFFSGSSQTGGWAPMATDSAFAKWAQNEAVFADIRSARAYNQDHIPGARHTDFYDFFKNPFILNDLSKDTLIIFYDFKPESKKAPLMVRQARKTGFPMLIF